MPYQSTKAYGHELGLSACFRQWRADSHCRFLHGYALAFTFTFECDKLDGRNWCMDFGGLKGLKEYLVKTFDHKLLIASDDPELETLKLLCDNGIADGLVFPGGSVGCEAFAAHMYHWTAGWLWSQLPDNRVWLVSVECREHGANSAIYRGK